MQKDQSTIILYRVKSDLPLRYPNAFITKSLSMPPKVKQLKQVFPWGQVVKETLPVPLTEEQQKNKNQEWILRFGLSMNACFDCDVWLDLRDQENVPMVGENQIFVQLQHLKS